MKTAENTFKKQLTNWVTLYSDELFSWAFTKVNNESVAKDLIQDTFLSAYKNIDKFEEKSSPKTWLISILKNKVAMYFRSQFKNKTISLSKFDYLMFDDKEKWINKNSPNWDQSTDLLDNSSFNVVLTKCLKALPDLWQIVVQLKYIDGKNGSDICNDLDISDSNYWQIVHRSKLKLRHCLNTNWFKNN